jgi:site-specific DNA-cytosine methylase
MNKLKWVSIQPLSGGMHIGAEQAFGCQAQYIISHPGFAAANERILLEYIKQRKQSVPYYVVDRDHFANSDIEDCKLYTTDWYKPGLSHDEVLKEIKSFGQIDVVISLPFCSALSMASGTQNDDRRGSTGIQNNNMKSITKYVLDVIKPKSFILENAPALYTNRGSGVRDVFNATAKEFDYSVTYIKTNSNVHSNVQYRQRTFAIFWQGKEPPPTIGTYNNPIDSVVKYLSTINKTAKHNDPIEDDCGKISIKKSPLYEFMVHKFGISGYRENLGKDRESLGLGHYIIKHGLFDDCVAFMEKNPPKTAPSLKTFKHWKEKVDQGLGYWDYSPNYYGDSKVPTVYFKTVPRNIHPTEERGFTMREQMKFMGLPDDLNWPEGLGDFTHKIGQNCPVQTAADFCYEIKRIVLDWNVQRFIHPDGDTKNNVYFHDNLCPEKSHYIDQKPFKKNNVGGFKF